MLELSAGFLCKGGFRKEIRAGEPSVYVLIHGGYWANTEIPQKEYSKRLVTETKQTAMHELPDKEF